MKWKTILYSWIWINLHVSLWFLSKIFNAYICALTSNYDNLLFYYCCISVICYVAIFFTSMCSIIYTFSGHEYFSRISLNGIIEVICQNVDWMDENGCLVITKNHFPQAVISIYALKKLKRSTHNALISKNIFAFWIFQAQKRTVNWIILRNFEIRKCYPFVLNMNLYGDSNKTLFIWLLKEKKFHFYNCQFQNELKLIINKLVITNRS